MHVEKNNVFTTIENTVKEKNGIFTLIRNGQAAHCRVQPGIMTKKIVKHNKPAVEEFLFHGCNSFCPLFELGEKIVTLHCGNKTVLPIQESKADVSN
jgi:hypothetical protein